MTAIDWHVVFATTRPMAELVVRGSAMYLLLFLALRLGFKRHSGGVGTADLLLVVLVGSAAQNAMVGGTDSIGDNGIVILAVLFWSWLFDRLAV